jgi:hypothetical protein
VRNGGRPPGQPESHGGAPRPCGMEGCGGCGGLEPGGRRWVEGAGPPGAGGGAGGDGLEDAGGRGLHFPTPQWLRRPEDLRAAQPSRSCSRPGIPARRRRVGSSLTTYAFHGANLRWGKVRIGWPLGPRAGGRQFGCAGCFAEPICDGGKVPPRSRPRPRAGGRQFGCAGCLRRQAAGGRCGHHGG